MKKTNCLDWTIALQKKSVTAVYEFEVYLNCHVVADFKY